jgi:hypothetical protein
MGKPGSIYADGYSYAYSAQDETSPAYPGVSVPAIMRPDAESLTFDGGALETVFTVRGGNVRNGWVWYYDANDNYIGQSTHFYDQKTDSSATNFKAGYFDSSSGARNTLVLSAGDIVGSNGTSITPEAMDLIRHCRVFVTDGRQYESGVIQYDYRAMSSYF